MKQLNSFGIYTL